MLKSDVHILVVDDDATLGKAMTESLTRAGYRTTLVSKPDDALKAIKFESIQLAIVDCMLPKMNGRDLAKKLKEESSYSNLSLILTSGIYKDKAFIRDSLKSTGAATFLTKPFDLGEFMKEVDKILTPLIEVPMARIAQFLSLNDISPKERIKAVDEADTIHAFDLPWIFSLLMHPQLSGHLNIISADGDVSGVGFSNGEIVQVYQEDQQSYFGVLLVEHGYVDQEEIDKVMKDPNVSGKIGSRLIDASLISPHALDLVMNEQQGLRLSHLIEETSVKINFIDMDDIRPNGHMDRSMLAELMNEWLLTKITPTYLKSYYMPWMTYNLKKGPEWSGHHRVLSLPVVQRAPNIARLLLESYTLEAALNASKVPEAQFFQAAHALIINRLLRFGEQISHVDFGDHRVRLEKINATLEGQNHFERLGLSPKAKDSELKRNYYDLAKVLHPDKLAKDAPADLRALAEKTFEKINTAYNVLSDAEKRAKYSLELERGREEHQLEAESLSEEARPLLSRGDYKKARDLLDRAVSIAPPTSNTRLLHIWSKIKSSGAETDLKLQASLKDELNSLPPEDRHSSLFYFVRGLLLKASGDPETATKNFQQVLSQAPDFIDARREMNLIQQAEQTAIKNVNILSGDLKDVVGMLFGKKK